MNSKKDISLSAALLLLALIALTVIGLSNFTFLKDNWRYIANVFVQEKIFILAVLGVSLFNFIFIFGYIERAISHKKQGSRLRSIKGEDKSVKFTKSFLIAAPLYISIWYFVLNLEVASHMNTFEKLFSFNVLKGLSLGIHINNFLLIAVFLGVITRLYQSIGQQSFWENYLPRMEKPTNGIVLGSVGEEISFDKVIKAKWLSVNKKALNGNILVTGSIGSGKTQGTILSYLKQVIGNFETRPSILVLDPKGTFIPEFLKIAKEYELEMA